MKRDMDLIRDILITIADSENYISPKIFVDDNNDLDKVFYNVSLTKEAGLINANISRVLGER